MATITTSDGREHDPSRVFTNHPDDVGPNGPDGATIDAPAPDLTNSTRYRHDGQGEDGLTPVQRARMEEEDVDGYDDDPSDASPEDARTDAEADTRNTEGNTEQV